MAVTRVLLVRHGQSEWNALGRWQGQADPPLSELGQRQARVAAQALGALDAIVASDLERAAHTAHLIAEALGIGPVVIDPDLRERDAGEWSGLTRAEIEERYPGYLGPAPTDAHETMGGATSGANHGVVERRPPGWEPDESVLARATAALRRIHDLAPGGDVLAVTHGGLIYVLEGHLQGTFARLANGGGRWVEVDDTGPLRLGERVLLVDEDAVAVTTPKEI